MRRPVQLVRLLFLVFHETGSIRTTYRQDYEAFRRDSHPWTRANRVSLATSIRVLERQATAVNFVPDVVCHRVAAADIHSFCPRPPPTSAAF